MKSASSPLILAVLLLITSEAKSQVTTVNNRVFRDFDRIEVGRLTTAGYASYKKVASYSNGILIERWITPSGNAITVKVDDAGNSVEVLTERRDGSTRTENHKLRKSKGADYDVYYTETPVPSVIGVAGFDLTYTNTETKSRASRDIIINHEGVGGNRDIANKSKNISADRFPASGGIAHSEVWVDKDGTVNHYVQEKSGKVTTERFFPNDTKERNGVPVENGNDKSSGGSGGNKDSGKSGGGNSARESKESHSERVERGMAGGGRGQ
jgi:hypothetical protein